MIDVHAHTQYSYCANGVEARDSIERSQRAGLAGVTLTDHAGQLYCSAEDFWSTRFLNEPGLIREYREKKLDRTPGYLSQMMALRSELPDFVKLGFEVELDCEGKLTLLEEDRPFFDLLLGSVHWLPGKPDVLTRPLLIRAFMEFTEGLIASGIDVLAHPFRYFYQLKEAPPVELYHPVARLLSAYGVAAEVNFHINEPDPAFYAVCLNENVKIAVGSDSHRPEEVGDFRRHRDLLKAIGAPENLQQILFPTRST